MQPGGGRGLPGPRLLSLSPPPPPLPAPGRPRPPAGGEGGARRQRLRAPAARGRGLGRAYGAGGIVRRQQRARARRALALPPSRLRSLSRRWEERGKGPRGWPRCAAAAASGPGARRGRQSRGRSEVPARRPPGPRRWPGDRLALPGLRHPSREALGPNRSLPRARAPAAPPRMQPRDSLRKSIPQPSTSRFLGFGPGTSTCLATEHGNFYSNGPGPNCLMSEAEVILDPALSSSPILVTCQLVSCLKITSSRSLLPFHSTASTIWG
ncbi:translation initiation factor IF-2-like [Canis lupus dingo]|uniref:translation initiation factor IF-2-like n=1 Tax=Canis lupus dingo TaxID=286419 RepID=UPI0020C2426F|nr:translation initiation factor IF-2-like [Canis lupus dingo]